MKRNHLHNIFVICLTVIATHACACHNHEAPSTKSKSERAGTFNHPSGPTRPIRSVQKAIAELEKAIKNNMATPQMKNVYKIIEHLPETMFYQGSDGSLLRRNEEKSGKELYAKFIDTIPFTEAMYKTDAPEILENIVDWLVEEQLLEANEIDEQGNTPLEQLILSFNKKPFNIASLKRMIDTWMKQGAQLNSNKASKLLEELVKNPTFFSLKLYADIVDYLTEQGAQLLPDKASEELEKLIEIPDFDSKEYREILNFFIKQGATLNKVTTLFKEAVKKSDKGLYKLLLKLGVCSNIEVNELLIDSKPLLHVLATDRSKEGKEIFQLLIKDPKTNINITTREGLTLAMKESYDHTYGFLPMLIDDLLQRDDLDINEIKASDDVSGVEGFTLLNMVIDNCSIRPHGHDWQMSAQLNNNKKWLEVLEKMSKHKNYFVNTENINLAIKKVEQLKDMYTLPDDIYIDAVRTAGEVLNILEKSPRKL
jgi:ankyrin repeat protein